MATRLDTGNAATTEKPKMNVKRMNPLKGARLAKNPRMIQLRHLIVSRRLSLVIPSLALMLLAVGCSGTSANGRSSWSMESDLGSFGGKPKKEFDYKFNDIEPTGANAKPGSATAGRSADGSSTQDLGRQFFLLKQAAEAGDAAAQNNLGFLYWAGEGIPRDYGKAFVWYSRSAAQGIATAEFNLGVLYREGQGVPQDDKKAVEWIAKAAERGFSTAQYSLGKMYHDGQGVPQDDAKANEWLRKAAAQGDSSALSALGRTY